MNPEQMSGTTVISKYEMHIIGQVIVVRKLTV